MRANQPSRTALVIAASQLGLASDPALGGLVPPLAAACGRQCLRSAGREALLCLAEQPAGRALADWLERRTLPGLRLHWALRKRWLSDWTLSSLGQGLRQVVVLGAGFDALGLALSARFPAARFIEVDHPATQAVKQAALQRLALAPANLHFVAADLGAVPLAQALAACPGWAAAAPTLYLAEGLLMYLRQREVLALLAQLPPRAPARIAFSFLEPQPDGRPGFRRASRWIDLWLRLQGEPFTWCLERQRLQRRLARAGWAVREIADAEHLVARYLAPLGLAERRPLPGELLCVADRPAGAEAASRS